MATASTFDPAPPRRTAARSALLVIAFAALVLPVCWSLLTSYLIDGHDTTEYLMRTVEFDRNIRAGVLFPQWAPDFVRGTGEPFFVFNPPLVYALPDFLHLLGANFILAINLATVVVIVASAIGMFLLGRLYFGALGGWLGTAAFLYAPYFAVELYVRSALAEFFAFPFYAFALYGFGAYAKCRKSHYLLLGSVAYAGVLLSHNAAALFFTPMLLGFFMLTAASERSWRVLLNDGLAMLLGIGVGACVWIPALLERPYVNLQRLTEGFLNYTIHFVYWHQFASRVWGYGTSIPGDQDRLSFSLGWTHLALVLAVFVLSVRFRRVANWRWLGFFAGITIVFCFLMTSASLWIWDHVSLLQYTGYPWRMLGPTCLCIALMVAALGPLLEQLRWRKAAFAATLAVLIAPNILHNRPLRYRAENLAEWSPTRLSIRGIEPSTVFEYVPRWVRLFPIYNPRGVWFVSGDATVDVGVRTPISWSGEVAAKTPTTLDLAVAWYPGWTVMIDGRQASATPADPTGLVRVTVPPGTHLVQAVFRRTWDRLMGQIVSLASILTILLLALSSWIRPSPVSRAA